MWRKQTRPIAVLIFMCMLAAPVAAWAQTSSSNNYQVQEYQFGTGGNPDLNSSSYNANASIGSLGVGRSSSTNYDAESGLITPSEPFLELFVNFANVSLGTLDGSTTGTGTGVFWVRTYLSGAYTVQTMSPSLTSESGRVIPGMALGLPQVGTEQFGINLVDNSSPDIGSDPFNVPDNNFADAEAATDYNVPGQFKYGQGDIIARSAASVGNQAVGRTDFTISYIANVSNITPAGSYVMVHDVVVVATF